jgi:sugar phosphate isomerase/epimerase
MGNIGIGINIEFIRREGGTFEYGMDKAAELGFEYVEPMIHWGRELLSEAGYFHSVSMLGDPLDMRAIAERNDLKISALSAHSPLTRPDISVDYLKQAVRFAKESGSPMIITDDGPARPAWASDDELHTLMRYTLEEAVHLAEPRGIIVALETHAEFTATPEALERTVGLVDSRALAINFDTGNSYLSGNDPHAWLEQIIDRVVHVHAKDISQETSDKYRGKVRGMLGCACGDGIIDWERIVATCRQAPQDIVLSIECGSVEDARRSLEHFRSLGV